jgi:hypothetical protein
MQNDLYRQTERKDKKSFDTPALIKKKKKQLTRFSPD